MYTGSCGTYLFGHKIRQSKHPHNRVNVLEGHTFANVLGWVLREMKRLVVPHQICEYLRWFQLKVRTFIRTHSHTYTHTYTYLLLAQQAIYNNWLVERNTLVMFVGEGAP